ncbi:hypothetical protein F5J12DRAFT_783584 [Pisolithus orientalis]|uniref:uncharacterized protein n=1 Tax=Pisolithus orientalis TaxID=936130 RepID=UPI0022242C73|nr:uncharacterized protein F5J12DRAFT_783578 [Pisolithus orientalis]XP_051599058.1 uncharacterized protein F5J12DRAFT_783584 [Pisolithus orientalis]KAI6003517.1 hypothetical protein F5J12DRAFT_783578 [Pisolithus orientalis]KAI6003523.1 hypothetical protein F5J12DRAFT_783584 [Pisolithus orientalis]
MLWLSWLILTHYLLLWFAICRIMHVRYVQVLLAHLGPCKAGPVRSHHSWWICQLGQGLTYRVLAGVLAWHGNFTSGMVILSRSCSGGCDVPGVLSVVTIVGPSWGARWSRVEEHSVRELGKDGCG